MAGSASGIRAGRAYVELGVQDKLAAGLAAAARKLKSFGAGVAKIGAITAGLGGGVAGPMIAAALGAAKSGAELYDMSQRTGIAVETLSLFNYAAQQTGTTLDGVEVGIRRMQKSIAGVSDATEGTTGSLEHLGIAASDIAGKSVEDQFAMIAGALRQIENPTERAAAAMKVFGRSGTELLPLIDDFDRLRSRATSKGLIMSSATATEAKRFEELWIDMRITVAKVWGAIGTAIMPVLKDFADWVANAAITVREWLKDNAGLIKSIFIVAVAAIAAGTVLTWIGGVIAALGTILGVVGTIFSVVAAIIGAICSPIGLVIAAVAAAGAAILYFTGAGSKALSWLGEKFGGLKDDAVDSYNGICDALASGNIGLAARIVWLTLKMWWSKGVAWISGIWNDCIGWLTRSFFEAVGGWRIIFEQIGHGLTVAWIATTKFLSDIWYNFVYGIQVAWNWCGMMLTKAWNKIRGVFDRSFDANAANRAAQQAYEAKVSGLRQERDAKTHAAAEQYDRDMAAERELNWRNLQDIVDQTEAKINADRKAREATAAGHEREVEEAKAAWRDSLAQAKAEREAKDKARRNDEAPSLLDRSKTALTQVSDLGKGPARGTFNARAILGLEIGSNGQRLVNATESTARNTGEIVKRMTGGAKFK